MILCRVTWQFAFQKCLLKNSAFESRGRQVSLTSYREKHWESEKRIEEMEITAGSVYLRYESSDTVSSIQAINQLLKKRWHKQLAREKCVCLSSLQFDGNITRISATKNCSAVYRAVTRLEIKIYNPICCRGLRHHSIRPTHSHTTIEIKVAQPAWMGDRRYHPSESKGRIESWCWWWWKGGGLGGW